MEEHISFEELSKFVWIERVNAETLALSLRVNRHLVQCKECSRRVEKLQQIYDDARILRDRKLQLERVNRKLKEVNENILPQYRGIRTSISEKDD